MIRATPALMFALMLAAAPAMPRAAEMSVPSHIDTVTVFPSGAEVARVFDVRLEAGSHVLVLADLPSAVSENSIRVEGETSGTLEIGSVDARPIVVRKPRGASAPDDTERRRIEDEIRRLTDARAAQDGIIAAATAQKALAENLSKLPLSPAARERSAPDPDWNMLFELIGARIGQAAQAAREAQLRQRDLDDQIKVLSEKLQHEPPEEAARTELRIHAEAGGPVQGRLRVRYQVAGASWLPIYDARLMTGGGGRDAGLTIARRASISQETGEDWTDADITLSTTQPGGSTSAPDLRPMKVIFRPEAQPMAAAPSPSMMKRQLGGQPDKLIYDRLAGGTLEERVEGALAQARAVDNVNAKTEAQPYQTSFRIPSRVTVKSGVGQKKVFISADTWKPTLMVRSSPRKDATAYLHARFTHDGIAPLLPGEVSLYRDGVFTGRATIPLIVKGEEKELGFGQDDAVKVTRVELKRAKGESGIIASSTIDEQHYKITVKNLHDWPMPVTILDQIPVSEEEKILVDLLPMTTEPTERNHEDKQGVLAWTYELKPQEEKAIALSYEMKWPTKRDILTVER